MAKGRFISVEGGEGVGKSSFVEQLVSKLEAAGKKTIRTLEPGGTRVADRIRELFVNPPADESLCIEAEFCLLSASRAQHVKNKIHPAMESGHYVICDRFADSSRVYQGIVGGIPSQVIEGLIELTTFGLNPDLSFLLDCDVSIALERIETRLRKNSDQTASRYDKSAREFHEKLRKSYLQVAKQFPQRFVVLDASRPVDLSVAQAMEEIERRF